MISLVYRVMINFCTIKSFLKESGTWDRTVSRVTRPGRVQEKGASFKTARFRIHGNIFNMIKHFQFLNFLSNTLHLEQPRPRGVYVLNWMGPWFCAEIPESRTKIITGQNFYSFCRKGIQTFRNFLLNLKSAKMRFPCANLPIFCGNRKKIQGSFTNFFQKTFWFGISINLSTQQAKFSMHFVNYYMQLNFGLWLLIIHFTDFFNITSGPFQIWRCFVSE